MSNSIKIGTETNSATNYLMGTNNSKPIVSKGATILQKIFKKDIMSLA